MGFAFFFLVKSYNSCLETFYRGTTSGEISWRRVCEMLDITHRTERVNPQGTPGQRCLRPSPPEPLCHSMWPQGLDTGSWSSVTSTGDPIRPRAGTGPSRHQGTIRNQTAVWLVSHVLREDDADTGGVVRIKVDSLTWALPGGEQAGWL